MAREITDEKDSEKKPEPARPRRHLAVRILGFVNLLIYSAALVAMVLIYTPGADAPNPRSDAPDLLETIKEADAEALAEVVLSEEAINAHLERTLLPNDSGEIARVVSHGRAWVDLHEDRAEVFLERRIFGHVSTIALELTLEQKGSGRILTLKGGRFGCLPVPRGALRLVLGAFASLKDAYPEEIASILAAKKITFAPGKMILSLF